VTQITGAIFSSEPRACWSLAVTPETDGL